MKTMLLISFLVLFTAAANAEQPLCFSTKAQWAALKAASPSKLPAILADVPLYLFTPGNGLLSGSMKLEPQADGRFRMDFTGYHSVAGDQSSTAVIKSVCVMGKQIAVSTVGGTDKVIEITGSNTVQLTQYRLLSYTFVKGTADDFNLIKSEARASILAAERAAAENARRAGSR